MILSYLWWGLGYLCVIMFGLTVEGDKSCCVPWQMAVCCLLRLAPWWWIISLVTTITFDLYHFAVPDWWISLHTVLHRGACYIIECWKLCSSFAFFFSSSLLLCHVGASTSTPCFNKADGMNPRKSKWQYLHLLLPRPHPWGESLVRFGWFLGLH